MDKKLYDKIIAANIDVHEKEAKFYDIIHAFGMNWYTQRVLTNDMDKIVKLAPGKKTCDLGCGTGNITQKLLERNCFVTAVDLSEPMLKQLDKNINAKDNIKIFCKNVDEFLEENTDRYDIITMSAVLHHMPDYIDTISKAIEHLSCGGLIYINDGFHSEKVNRFREFAKHLFTWFDRRVYTFLYGNRDIIFNNDIDYAYSDYHHNAAGTNGLDLSKIKEIIEREDAKLIYSMPYSVGMLTGTLAMLDDIFSISKNCFRLLAQKRSGIN